MKKVSSYIPLVITVAGGIFISMAAVSRLLKEPPGPGGRIAWFAVGVYFFWKLLESRITVGETSKGENHDRGTVEMCAVVEIVLLCSLFFCSGNVWFPAAAVGLAVLVAGLVLRFTAIAALGDSYSLRIREIVHGPVSLGPYSFVRHPSYLGTLLAHTGVVLVFPGVWSFLLLALWFVAVSIRAVTEERFLRADPEYVRYSGKIRWLLIPGLF